MGLPFFSYKFAIFAKKNIQWKGKKKMNHAES